MRSRLLGVLLTGAVLTLAILAVTRSTTPPDPVDNLPADTPSTTWSTNVQEGTSVLEAAQPTTDPAVLDPEPSQEPPLAVELPADLLVCNTEGEVARRLREPSAMLEHEWEALRNLDWETTPECCELTRLGLETRDAELVKQIINAEERRISRGNHLCEQIAATLESLLLEGTWDPQTTNDLAALLTRNAPGSERRVLEARPDLLRAFVMAGSQIGEELALRGLLETDDPKERKGFLITLRYGEGHVTEELPHIALDPAEDPNFVGAVLMTLSVTDQGQARSISLFQELFLDARRSDIAERIPSREIEDAFWNTVAATTHENGASRTRDVIDLAVQVSRAGGPGAGEVLAVLEKLLTKNDSRNLQDLREEVRLAAASFEGEEDALARRWRALAEKSPR